MKNDEKKSFKERLKKDGLEIAVYIFAIGAFCIMLFGMIIILHNTEINLKPLVFNSPSDMGDYFSGMVGPLLSFASGLLFLAALLYQKKDMNDNRVAQKDSKTIIEYEMIQNLISKQIELIRSAEKDDKTLTESNRNAFNLRISEIYTLNNNIQDLDNSDVNLLYGELLLSFYFRLSNCISIFRTRLEKSSFESNEITELKIQFRLSLENYYLEAFNIISISLINAIVHFQKSENYSITEIKELSNKYSSIKKNITWLEAV